MKKIKKLCGAVLIAGFMLPQIAMGSIGTAEAASGTWKQDSKGWWYSYSDGTHAKSTWLKLGGKWYYFNANGYMVKKWQQIGGKWYFFGSNGAMRTGWQKVGGKWYYFTSSGAMKTGWLSSGGKWYYFDASGAMTTGWKKTAGKWYYFNSNGAMVTGKTTISGKTYSFGKDGVLIGELSDDVETGTFNGISYIFPDYWNKYMDMLINAGIASPKYKGTFIGINGSDFLIYAKYDGEVFHNAGGPDESEDSTANEWVQCLLAEYENYRNGNKIAVDLNGDGKINGLDICICSVFSCGKTVKGVLYNQKH